MKKTLLAILALGMTSLVFAQDVLIAENLPTLSGDGFNYGFKRSTDPMISKDVINCLPDGGGVSNNWGSAFGGNPNLTFAIHPTDNKLVMTVPTALSGQIVPNRFPKGNCSAFGGAEGTVDFNADKRVHMIVHTTVKCTLSVHLAVLQGGYGEPDGNVANPRPEYVLLANTKYELCGTLPTISSSDVDFTANLDKPLGFVFKITTEADNAVLTFEKLAFGDAASVPTGTNNILESTNDAVLDNSLINVYPTPSSDVLNVDLSKLSAGAELKLVSASGETVYTASTSEALAKIDVANYTSGLYALQITSEGKSTTKKVVIK